MALLKKAGTILRQTVCSHINHEISAANPSIFQMIRCMSSSKLFVGGLAYATDDMSLREAFSKYGEVQEARVIVDRETGRSRGFGFVTYTQAEEASAAIQAMDQRDLHGRMVRVNYANDRSEGGGNYGGGSYGGGSYGGGNYSGTNYGNDRGYGGGDRSYGGGGSDSYASGGGSDSYASGGGNNSFAAPGAYDGNTVGGGGSTNMADADGGQFGGNYKDDAEPVDYADRRA